MRSYLLLGLAIFLPCLVVHADTVNFSYYGSPPASSSVGGESRGTGSFSYGGSPTSLTLSTLNAFSFQQTTDIVGNYSTFLYSFADLTSFSATLSGDTLLTLMLTTDMVSPIDGPVSPGELIVTSLGYDGTIITNYLGNPLLVGDVTETSYSASSTPEPSTLTLLGTGMLAMLGAALHQWRRRDRKAGSLPI